MSLTDFKTKMNKYKINNNNKTNTTGAQNFKEFNNTAGWLSVFFVWFFFMN